MCAHEFGLNFKPMVLHARIKEAIRIAQERGLLLTTGAYPISQVISWLEKHVWNPMIMQHLMQQPPTMAGPKQSRTSSSHSQHRSIAKPIAQHVPVANAAAAAPAAAFNILPAGPKKMPKQANKGKGRGMAKAKTEAKAKADTAAIQWQRQHEYEEFLRDVEDLRQAEWDLQKRGLSRHEVGLRHPKSPPPRRPGDIPRFLVDWMYHDPDSGYGGSSPRSGYNLDHDPHHMLIISP